MSQMWHAEFSGTPPIMPADHEDGTWINQSLLSLVAIGTLISAIPYGLGCARGAGMERIRCRTHGYPMDRSFESRPVTGARVLHPVDEAAWVSTNATAQWGPAAIECLAFAGLTDQSENGNEEAR